MSMREKVYSKSRSGLHQDFEEYKNYVNKFISFGKDINSDEGKELKEQHEKMMNRLNNEQDVHLKPGIIVTLVSIYKLYQQASDRSFANELSNKIDKLKPPENNEFNTTNKMQDNAFSHHENRDENHVEFSHQ